MVLGVYGGASPGQHDPSAALLRDGEIVAICEEERYSRVKSAWSQLPIRAVTDCLRLGGVTLNEVDIVVVPGRTHAGLAERTRAYLLHYFGACPDIEVIDHHLAHLASAFFPSGLNEAMCLSYDGYGDHISTALAVGRADSLTILETMDWQDSLGVFFSAVTSYLGFEPSHDVYKVMGLSAFGSPGIDMGHLIRPLRDGYAVDSSACFRAGHSTFANQEPLYGPGFDCLGPARRPSEPVGRRHADVAYAAQRALEECATSLVARLKHLTGLSDLCLAGGVALNCRANGVLSQTAGVDRLWVQPAASDRGLALGCALHGSVVLAGDPRPVLRHASYGGAYSAAQMRAAADMSGLAVRAVDGVARATARLLSQGKVVGWYQGRSEFGPRALGHRSILADPRTPAMRQRVNERVKFREEFRPFAPAILDDRAPELFHMSGPSPFMTVTYPVRDAWAESLGAVVHVDGTARVQTVSSSPFGDVIRAFAELTDVPAVLNTSFNVRGEPIVETPRDAVATFAGSGLDALVMDDLLLVKPGQHRLTK